MREDDLDLGQAFGNDYEHSKIEAEKLVRVANRAAGGFLESTTIRRPVIIAGDSATGWTSTYHGPFAVGHLGHTLLTRVALGATSGAALLRLIGVAVGDRKNFVPVDWVSAVIAHVVATPGARNATYHLTHPEPLSMHAVAELVQRAVETYLQAAAADDPDHLCDEAWFADLLWSQLEIYRSYLRNDPVFDRSRTDALAGHLPCPPLDMPRLMRMTRFAIDEDFGRRRRRPRAATAEATARAS